MIAIKTFFRKLFYKNNEQFSKEMDVGVQEPRGYISDPKYIKHPQGDFYVVDGDCTVCGAPEAEAPDLIEHQKDNSGHCYFKRQPQTDDEIDRAIKAVAVSCISGLRYRGTNENILKKLYEVGEQGQCDNKPIHTYQEVVRNKVEFTYRGTIQQLQAILQSNSLTRDHYRLLDLKTNNIDFFQFTLRWTTGLTGTIYRCDFGPGGECKIEMSAEKDGYFRAIISHSQNLNTILSKDENISKIRWFNFDGTSKPF